MAVHEAGRARAVRRRVAVAVCGCVAIAVVAYAFIRWTDRGDPDPGGRILVALQSIEAALPDDAAELSRQQGEPIWDSCDGREGTFGWSSVNVIITFRTATQPDVVMIRANDRLVAAGWTPASDLRSQFGPGRLWTRILGDGGKATAQLSAESMDNGQTITWQLSAYGPPHGPRVHGC